MSDIKLFKISNGAVVELAGSSVAFEKSLQIFLERNLEAFLGVRFLASEYTTGKAHGGRIDTLGIDENGCPVIIEYKRAINENVINQGLYYLDWLLDHKAEFELLVQKRLGREAAESIEWMTPRLLCIAGDFTKYDEHAIQQIDRNIELIRYRKYGDEMLILELVNASSAQSITESGQKETTKAKGTYKTVTEVLAQINGPFLDLYESLKSFLLSTGDDVQMKTLMYYIAFKRLKNFACVEIRPQVQTLLVFVKVDPAEVDFARENWLLRDVSKIGHFGTGDVEITIRTQDDFERAKPFILKSYDAS